MNLNKLWTFFLLASLFWACSDSDKTAGGTTEDAGIIADLNVAGLTQKGPFVKGSAVTVQGIDCKTLKFTDEKFEGKVKSDKGDFGIEDVNLSATCALFEVTGKYLDELTGKKSASEVTLHALTDLKDRKNVNINMLTELEYKRVMNLVMVEKMSFADAKVQAEKEVLAAFNVKSKDGEFAQFEDLSILEKGDDNAALLAVSVMMQSDLKVAKLVERVNDVAADIAKDGSWDDDKTKTEIAEWAATADKNGELANVGKNIEKWGGSSEVSSFETVVEKFAETVITDAVSNSSSVILSSGSREGSSSSKVPEPVEGSSSSKNVLSSSSSSVIASEAKQSSSAKSSSAMMNSSSVRGDISSSSSEARVSYAEAKVMASGTYDCSTYKCNSTEGLNQKILSDGKYGEILDERDGQVYKTIRLDNQVWMAQNLNYQEKGSVCYKNDEKNCSKYGRFYESASIGECPVGWHLPTKAEWSILFFEVGALGIQEKTSTAGEALRSQSGWMTGKSSDDYGFSAVSTGVGFKEDSSVIFSNVGYETDFWISSEKPLEFIQIFGNQNNLYVNNDDGMVFAPVRCVKNTSRMAIASSLSDDKKKLRLSDDNVSKDDFLNPLIEYDSLVDTRDGQVYKTMRLGTQVWMSQNLNYADSAKTPSLLSNSWCYDDDEKFCKVGGRLYTWAAAIDSVKLATDKDNPQNCGLGTLCEFSDKIRGICPEGWRLPNNSDWQSLIRKFGDRSIAGANLKSTVGWSAKNGTDDYGFTALPIGRKTAESYRNLGTETGFWSVTHSDEEFAYAMQMDYTSDIGFFFTYSKNNGFSVRCLKD